MPNPLQHIVKQQAYRILKLQCIVIAIMLLIIALITRNTNAILGAFVGSMTYLLPNFIFVWQVFRYPGAQQMTKFFVAFSVGEMLKLFLSASLVLMIVKSWPLSLLSVLIGFVSAMVAFWVACFWYLAKQAGTKPSYIGRSN